MNTELLKGSCLCGGITYEISAPLTDDLLHIEDPSDRELQEAKSRST